MDQETLQGKFVVAMVNEQHAQLTLVTDAPESQSWKGNGTISPQLPQWRLMSVVPGTMATLLAWLTT